MPVLLAIFLALLELPAALAADLSGRVRVLDGGSVQMGETVIQLWGIAPPPSGTRLAGRARDTLADTIAGEAIRCRPVESGDSRRVLAICRTADEVDLASFLVFAGYALDRTGRYAAQMDAARSGGRGIWGADDR